MKGVTETQAFVGSPKKYISLSPNPHFMEGGGVKDKLLIVFQSVAMV